MDWSKGSVLDLLSEGSRFESGLLPSVLRLVSNSCLKGSGTLCYPSVWEQVGMCLSGEPGRHGLHREAKPLQAVVRSAEVRDNLHPKGYGHIKNKKIALYNPCLYYFGFLIT